MKLADAASATRRPDPDTLPIALRSACTALWAATLSLMAAFMQTHAPAHRYLMARRIARNLATLHEQDCFSPESRDCFARLARRWNDKADRMARQEQRPHGGIGVLLQSRLWSRWSR